MAASRRAISEDSSLLDISSRSDLIVCSEYTDIKDFYSLGEELGRGTSGEVRMCFSARFSLPLACKSLSKSNLRSHLDVNDLQSEVKSLRIMQKHPSVVQLYGVHEDEKNVHLVTEMCTGGDLYTRLRKFKRFTEPEVARICKTLASILAACHEAGIMHRDVKPENILLVSPHSNTDIRLADFGSAAFFKPGQKLSQLVGSPLYISPGVLQHSYGSEADIWSLGVVLYVLLCGLPPFWGNNNAEIFRSIQNGPLNFDPNRWKDISEDAKNLVSRLLSRDRGNLMSAEDVLANHWILQHCPTENVFMSQCPDGPPPVRVSRDIPDYDSRRHSEGSIHSHHVPKNCSNEQKNVMAGTVPRYEGTHLEIPKNQESRSRQALGDPPADKSNIVHKDHKRKKYELNLRVGGS